MGRNRIDGDHAQEQLQVAEKAFSGDESTIAERAAHCVLLVWLLAQIALDAQYLLGRCYEVSGKDQAGVQRVPNGSSQISR